MTLVYDYFTLCKPKVVLVMLVTVWVGMHLAVPTFVPLNTIIFGTLGIALAAGSAAVINQLVDRHIDAKMSRTEQRPIACGRISPRAAFLFSFCLGTAGLFILNVYVNTLTAVLTFITVLGYAVFYTLFLKRATPQNIVIGGAAGATPPLLGWAAVSNDINAYALLLVLIIFTWTPPHFWALAIYRRNDYAKANIPMLPVTHGVKFTKICIVLYTLLLLATSLLPYVTGMSGSVYLTLAIVLGSAFLIQTLILFQTNHEQRERGAELAALRTFSFSITYLLLLFASLLLDHYLSNVI